MLDPLVLCVEFKRQLHWLTRADIFKQPRVNQLLRQLNMLPVYRERDRVDDLSAHNQVTFAICNERLKAGAIICMFPEGTHRGKKQLVPLKKGVARVALNALDSGLDQACILPVGLDYEDYYHYRKDLTVIVGDPIDLATFAKTGEQERSRTQTEIIRKVRLGLEAVMIDIENEPAYHEAMEVKPLLDKLATKQNTLGRFQYFQQFARNLGTAENPFSLDFEQHASAYISLRKKLRLNEKYYTEGRYLGAYALGWLILLIPACSAILCFSPIYFLTEGFVKKTVRDPLFKNSIRAAFWTFLVPLWLLLIGGVLALTPLSLEKIIGIITLLILSGWIALQWLKWHTYLRHGWKYQRLKWQKNPDFIRWVNERNRLIMWFKNNLKQ